LFAGRFEEAGECIEQLSRFAPQPSAVLQRQLIARWQAQQGWLLHLQGRMDVSRAHFLEALGELDPQGWPEPLVYRSGFNQPAFVTGELYFQQAVQQVCIPGYIPVGVLLSEDIS